MAEEARPADDVAMADSDDDEVEAQRRRRAERFGTEYEKSTKVSALDKALSDAKPGRDWGDAEVQPATGRPLHVVPSALAGGVDQFDPDQIEKRAARKQKWGEVDDAAPIQEVVLNDEERQRRLERAKKYGLDTKEVTAEVVMDVDVFEDRREASSAEGVRVDALHVFGTDTMATASVLLLFQGCAPKGVEWLNDSSANVVFDNPAAVQHAIDSLCTPLGAPTDDALPWHKYIADRNVRGIVVRNATMLDVKEKKKKKSRNLWVQDEKKHGGRYLPPSRKPKRAYERRAPRVPAADALDAPSSMQGRLGLQSRAARAEGGDPTDEASAERKAPSAAVLAARSAAEEKWLEPSELGIDENKGKKGRGEFLYEALMRDISGSIEIPNSVFDPTRLGALAGAGGAGGPARRRGRGNRQYKPYDEGQDAAAAGGAEAADA